MKKSAIFLIIIILIINLSSCVTDELYYTHADIVNEANNFIDDPLFVAEKYSLIQNFYDIDFEIKLATESLSRYPDSHQRIERLKYLQDLKLIYGSNFLPDTVNQMHLKDVLKDPDKTLNGIVYNCILFAPLSAVKMPSVQKYKTTNTGYRAAKKIAKHSYKNFSNFNIKIGTDFFKVKHGNDKWGMKHIIKRHSPKAYISRNKFPNIGTHLFLKSEISYISGLMKKINSGNIIKIETRSGYKIFHSNIRNRYGIKRTYTLVVEEHSRKVITFYPRSRLSLNMKLKLKGIADNYLIVVKKRDIILQNIK